MYITEMYIDVKCRLTPGSLLSVVRKELLRTLPTSSRVTRRRATYTRN